MSLLQDSTNSTNWAEPKFRCQNKLFLILLSLLRLSADSEYWCSGSDLLPYVDIVIESNDLGALKKSAAFDLVITRRCMHALWLGDEWLEFARVQTLDSSSSLASRTAGNAISSMSCMIFGTLLWDKHRALTGTIPVGEIQCLDDPEECVFTVVAVSATFQAARILAR